VRHATLFPPFLRARAVHAAPFVRKFSRHKLPVQVAATIPSPPPHHHQRQLSADCDGSSAESPRR
jgi:hypothetical protein